MEAESKNLDSANESVESFEDAIDHLEISDDPRNTSKAIDNNQSSDLTSDSIDVKKAATVPSLNLVTAPPVDSASSNKDTTAESTDTANIDIVQQTNNNNIVNAVIVPDSKNSPEIKTKNEADDKNVTSEVIVIPNLTSKNQVNETNQTFVESLTSNLTDISISETKVDQPVTSVKDISNKDSKEITKIETKEDCIIPTEKVEDITPKKPSDDLKPIELVEDSKPVESVKDSKPTESPDNLKSTESVKEPKEHAKDLPTEPIKVEIQKETTNIVENVNDGTLENDKAIKTDSNDVQTRSESHDESNNHKSEGELDEGSINSEERECGDGQGEQDEVKKELDHDEDKRNPEYIPKKGSFYEHDTRTMDGFDDDVKKIEEETAAKSKKKPKPVVEGRWAHDKYNEMEQCPKSQQEIIDTYGYDIRNEEHPPKARRNRRYGRGPNKYNRNWEDEKAYIKIETKPRLSGGRGPRQNSDREHRHPVEREEFPPLNRDENHGEKRSAKPISGKVADSEKSGGIHYSDKIGMKAEKGAWVPPPPFSQKNVVNKNSNNGDTESKSNANNHPSNAAHKDQPQSNEKSSPPKPKAFVPLNNAPFTPTSPARGHIRVSQANSNVLSHRNDIFPNGTKAPRSKLPESGLMRPRANWEPNNWYINQNKVETTGPPELPDPSLKDFSKLSGAGAVAALRGGKRYSVQRQQSLPESARSSAYGKESPVPPGEEVAGESNPVPPAGQLTAYYHHATGANAPPITVPQSSPSHLVFTQSPPPPTQAAPIIKGDYVNLNMPGETPIYHSNSFQPAPVYSEQTHPISNGGGGAPPMLLPVHFVSPPPAQVPAFSNNQAPIMSYGPHQPMQFQPMQPIVSLPPPPQPEVFQPAGGITYYSPQTQAVLQRPALSKRVKSAIPIVPPNEINNLMQQSAALLQQQHNLMQQQQQVQMVPVDINKEEALSN